MQYQQVVFVSQGKVQSFKTGSNQFAHAAALEVANNPGGIFNPLFIYGNVGLGKNHLLHAIGHSIRNNFPDKKVCHCNAAQFMYVMVHHLRQRNMQPFREYFRSIDVLLLEGIHFLSGKPATLGEFKIIYDPLYDAHKQIIIDSNLPPNKLPDFDRFLSSRFKGGLIAAIKPPDVETKLAILRKTAESEDIKLPDEVLNFFSFSSNCIRALKGFVIRIGACSRLLNIPITLELAMENMTDIFEDTPDCADGLENESYDANKL